MRSLLLINQRLCQNDDWNEELIDERSVDLSERVMRTWPGPDSDVWPATITAEAASSA